MSANSVCDKDVIGYTQGSEFISALVKAGMTKAMMQEVIESRGNRKAKTMMDALLDAQVADERFELKTTFDIVVPADYDHATRLDTFRREHGREFNYYNQATTDANYAAKATTKLTPGRRLKCKVFWINESVTSEECLGFLKSQKAILVGAQGASLICEQSKAKLPKGRYYASFDAKEALWEDSGGYLWVPFVDALSGGGFDFDLGYFESGWDDDFGLLCFCDEE